MPLWFDLISYTKLEDCRVKLKQMLSARPVGKTLRWSKTSVFFVLFRNSRLHSLMFRVTFKTGGWLTPILFESLEFRRFDSATFWMKRQDKHEQNMTKTSSTCFPNVLTSALDATCRIGAVGLEEAGGLKSSQVDTALNFCSEVGWVVRWRFSAIAP